MILLMGCVKLEIKHQKNKNWSAKKPDPSFPIYPYEIYNIASNRRIELIKYVNLIEKYLEKKS